MSAKWTAIKDEPRPEGHSPIYVTDGSRVSFVKRAVQAETEADRWILAEPEAEHLKLAPIVGNPTHWATALPGLPTVKAEDVPEIHEGGPPSRIDPDEVINFPEPHGEGAGAIKVKVVNDPLDHDSNGRKGGTK